MAMQELFAHPLPALFFKMVDAFPVERKSADAKAVRTALHRLRGGAVVCIFPEAGLRTGESSVLGGRDLPRGAAAVAQMANVPVRPCLVVGTDQFYAWQSLFRRPRVFVALGAELHRDPALAGREAVTELNSRIEAGLRDLYEQIRRRPDFSEKLVPRTAQERWAEK